MKLTPYICRSLATRKKIKGTSSIPTPSFLHNAFHQNPIFLKFAADLKVDQFEVEDLYILLG